MKFALANKPEDPRDTTAWALNALANLDRHRFIHASSLWLTEASRVMFDPPDGGTVDYSMDLPGPLAHGAVVAGGRLFIGPDGSVATVAVEGVPDLVLTSLIGYRGPDELRGVYVRGLEPMMEYIAMGIRAFQDPIAFLQREGAV